MRSPFCLCVCPPFHKRLNQFVDFYDIQYGGHVFEGDLDAIPFNSVASTIGRCEIIFPVASVSRPALGPTQPPVQWVPGALSPGAEARPGRDADHSPPYSAEVENE
jgi:hypothetical protein